MHISVSLVKNVFVDHFPLVLGQEPPASDILLINGHLVFALLGTVKIPSAICHVKSGSQKLTTTLVSEIHFDMRLEKSINMGMLLDI